MIGDVERNIVGLLRGNDREPHLVIEWVHERPDQLCSYRLQVSPLVEQFQGIGGLVTQLDIKRELSFYFSLKYFIDRIMG